MKTAWLFALGLACAGLAGAETIYAVDGSANLIEIDSGSAAIVDTVALSGVSGDVEGIDFRPLTGVLYLLSRNPEGPEAWLYTVNVDNGVATLVAALSADPADLSDPFVALAGDFYGMDFNPVADRIRVVSNFDQNLRIHPVTAQVTTDADLNPGDPSVQGIAYTNNFAGALTTTLYDIDAILDQLFRQDPPDAGTLTFVGNLGVTVLSAAFDISPNTGLAFAIMAPEAGGGDTLYTVNLANGAASPVGAVGALGDGGIHSLSIAPAVAAISVPGPGPVGLAALAFLLAAASWRMLAVRGLRRP